MFRPKDTKRPLVRRQKEGTVSHGESSSPPERPEVLDGALLRAPEERSFLSRDLMCPSWVPVVPVADVRPYMSGATMEGRERDEV